jgi:hypothetical protein
MSTVPRAIVALPFALGAWAAALPALAHGIVGDRFFPATLTTDDPAVADELSLPTISTTRTGDAPPDTEVDVSGEWSKRLTSRFGVSFDGGWTDLKTPSGDITGFQNLGTTFKYMLVADPVHELMVSTGVEVEWGGTGDPRLAEEGTTVTPTLYFGKGAGDLPESLALARPLALTGVIGYGLPVRGGEPRTLETGFAVEYSLRYLAAHVRDYGFPEFVNQLTPVVEVQLETPLGHGVDAPTGTVNPGVIWSGRRIQLGAEAVVPVNGASGHAIGAIFQVHWFIDDMFPHSLGKPIW